MPFPSSVDNYIEAAKQLAHDLLHTAPSASFYHIGDSTMAAMKQLLLVLSQQPDAI